MLLTTLSVLYLCLSWLPFVTHCAVFRDISSPPEEADQQLDEEDEELSRTFLDLLGLEAPPIVNRTRAVNVPEYVEHVYGRGDVDTTTWQEDREVRAIRASHVNCQSRHIDVTFELSDVQTSILADSDVQQLLLRWDVTALETSPHVKPGTRVAVCTETGDCSNMVTARRQRFTGRREGADILDISKALSGRSAAHSASLRLRLRLRLKRQQQQQADDVTDVNPADLFLVLFRSVPRSHHDVSDVTAEQPIRSQRVRRDVVGNKIRKHVPTNDVVPAGARSDDQELGAGCDLLSWYISFEELGWGDWIIMPRGFTANHCSGQCLAMGNVTLNFTNHAYIKNVYLQRAHRLMQPVDPAILPVFCVPVRLYALSLLFLNSENEIVNRVMTEMMAESCACL